jgi:hypothetical protein
MSGLEAAAAAAWLYYELCGVDTGRKLLARRLQRFVSRLLAHRADRARR